MRTYRLIEDLLPMVLRDCPQVPREVVMHELRTACIAFCRKTRYWREDIVPVMTQMDATIQEYEVFSLAPECVPIATLSLQADGRPLEPVSEDELDRSESNWRTKEGRPSQFISTSAAWVRPIPIATTAVVKLTGKIAVAPARDGNYIIDDLFESYGDAISSLAKNSLMLMPGKPWTNAEMAVYHLQVADFASSEATATASRNFSAAPKRRCKALWY